MTITAISEKIKDLEFLAAQQADLKESIAALNKRVDAAEADVIAAIMDMEEENGVDDLRVTVNGRNYSVTTKEYFSIPKAQRDTAYPLLRDLGLGELITERVDDRSLSKELAVIMEDNGGELPPEYEGLGLTRYTKPTLRNVRA